MYPFIFNGGGVAAGDINNDGLPDIFLTGNMESSRLYLNQGDFQFKDITESAGDYNIADTSFTTHAAFLDYNRDDLPDLYVSNDLLPNDVLYINNGDGTFSDKAGEYLKHTSFAGMGVDIADFNNDGWPDILQADMMPPDYNDQKLMNGGISYEYFENRLKQGYHYSFTMNILQMSNGIDSDGAIIFSEIARMAGVAYTGWGWAALFGDYDNNGYKDIMITNGFPKAVSEKRSHGDE